MLLLLNLSLVLLTVVVEAADLVIRIPGDLSQQDGFYRLDYRCSGWRGAGGGGEGVLRVAPPTWVMRLPPSSSFSVQLLWTLSNAFRAPCIHTLTLFNGHKARTACIPSRGIFGRQAVVHLNVLSALCQNQTGERLASESKSGFHMSQSCLALIWQTCGSDYLGSERLPRSCFVFAMKSA